MYRVLPWLLVSALMATSGLAPLLHSHSYGDHDHPEHRHGPAAHEHRAIRDPPDEGAARLEACDSGQHTVSFAFVCAAPPQVHASEAELTVAAPPTSDPQVERVVGHTEVRAHGPPSRAHASPRAPPPIAHA